MTADNTQYFYDLEYHIINDNKPSLYINMVSENNFFSEYPFTMINDLKKIEQSPVHHPEGNVWNHTMMVLDNAAERRHQSRDLRVFMWSALLHDIGKVPATKIRKGKITAYDHDKYGEELVKRFLMSFSDDDMFIKNVAAMVRWHMQILYVLKNLPFANIREMLRQVQLDEIALLSYCDRLGRGGLSYEKAEEEKQNVDRFIQACRAYS